MEEPTIVDQDIFTVAMDEHEVTEGMSVQVKDKVEEGLEGHAGCQGVVEEEGPELIGKNNRENLYRFKIKFPTGFREEFARDEFHIIDLC